MKKKQIMLELLKEVRQWNKEWDLAPTDSTLKSADEFADELTEKYNVTKNKEAEQPTAPIEQPATFTFTPSKTYAGYYCLGGKLGYCIGFEKKPNWFHRIMMNLCLGWKWIDATKH
jgi:hypothetical protein